jgi:hypothetical protein
MNYSSLLVIVFITLHIIACVPVATTAAGVGGSAAITHTLNGTAYRTFTAPASKVRSATMSALERMKIKVVSESQEEKSKIRFLTAKTTERNIEIHIEPISANTTRVSVAAKSSVFSYDSATAEEILQQTKKVLG